MSALLKRLWDEFLSYIFQILFSFTLTIMSIIIAWIQHQTIPLYLIPIGLVFAFGLSLWVTNNYIIIKSRLAEHSNKKIENLIREWITTSALSFKRMSVDEKLYYFHFGITDNSQRNINLIRSKAKPNIIDIVAELTLTKKNKPIPKQLMNKLSIEMARFGIQFEFVNNDKIRLVEQVLFDNSLTDFYFRQHILFVIRALALAKWVALDFYH